MSWKTVRKNGKTAFFKDVETVHGDKVLIRIGIDGVTLFGKNESANAAYFDKVCFAGSTDFQGTNGKGFMEINCGAMRVDGSIWFSDGIYECLAPGEYDSIKRQLTRKAV